MSDDVSEEDKERAHALFRAIAALRCAVCGGVSSIHEVALEPFRIAGAWCDEHHPGVPTQPNGRLMRLNMANAVRDGIIPPEEIQ